MHQDAKTADRFLMVTALAAVTWLMSTFFVRLDEPWDQSLGGTTSGAYYGLAARAFEVHGLGNLRLQPLHFYQPNTTKTVFAYRNHPPFPHLITATAYRLLGHDERSLRLPIFLLTCLTVLGTFMAARRRPGHEVAWIALCLLAATPMFFQYGDMVDAPSFSLVTLVWAWLAWERHRRLRSGRSLTLWLIAGGLAGLSDWFGYLLVPVLWLDLLIRRRDERPWRLAFIAGLPFGLALVAFCLWLIWTAGWQGALDQLLNLSRVPSRNDTTSAGQEVPFLAAMVKHVARGWTWPTLVLIGLGAIQALTRRNAAARTALALSAAGLLPCLAFSSRAAVHEFWILQAVPGLAILAALPVAALWQRTRVTRAWPLVALAIVAMTALGIRQGHALHAEYRTDRWVDFGRAMNEFVGPNDVVLYPNDTEPWRFYCEAATIPLYRSVFAHRAIMDALQPGRDEIEHLYVMWPSDGPVVLELQPLVGIGRSLQKIPDRGGYASLIEIDRQRAFDLFR